MGVGKLIHSEFCRVAGHPRPTTRTSRPRTSVSASGRQGIRWLARRRTRILQMLPGPHPLYSTPPAVSMTESRGHQTLTRPPFGPILHMSGDRLLRLQLSGAWTWVWCVNGCSWTDIGSTTGRHRMITVPGSHHFFAVRGDACGQVGIVGLVIGQGQPVIDRIQVPVVVHTGELARTFHTTTPPRNEFPRAANETPHGGGTKPVWFSLPQSRSSSRGFRSSRGVWNEGSRPHSWLIRRVPWSSQSRSRVAAISTHRSSPLAC